MRWWLSSTLVLAGCMSATEGFAPAEHATTTTPQGLAAAEYDAVIDGDVVADVKLWSSGAFVEERDDTDYTLLHVGFLIENTSDEELVLDTDGLELDAATMDERVLDPMTPLEIVGSPRLEPNDEREIAVYFQMPPGVMPQHLDAFRVRWTLSSPRGRYTQNTPFLEYHPPQEAYFDSAYGYYYSPYYDPFIVGPVYPERTIIVRPR